MDAVPLCLPPLWGLLCSHTVAVPLSQVSSLFSALKPAHDSINAPACTCSPDFALTDSLPGQHLQLGIQDVCQAPVPEPPAPCSSLACSPRPPIAMCSISYSSSCVNQSLDLGSSRRPHARPSSLPVGSASLCSSCSVARAPASTAALLSAAPRPLHRCFLPTLPVHRPVAPQPHPVHFSHCSHGSFRRHEPDLPPTTLNPLLTPSRSQ